MSGVTLGNNIRPLRVRLCCHTAPPNVIGAHSISVLILHRYGDPAAGILHDTLGTCANRIGHSGTGCRYLGIRIHSELP